MTFLHKIIVLTYFLFNSCHNLTLEPQFLTIIPFKKLNPNWKVVWTKTWLTCHCVTALLLQHPTQEEAVTNSIWPSGCGITYHRSLKRIWDQDSNLLRTSKKMLKTELLLTLPSFLLFHNTGSVSPAAHLATIMPTRSDVGSVLPTVSPALAATVTNACPVNMDTSWMKKPTAVLLTALMDHIRTPVSWFQIFGF